LADAPHPKSPYGSVKMTVYFDIINLMGDCMVVKELKSPYENKPFYFYFLMYVFKKN
jgi:hypothetical protein